MDQYWMIGFMWCLGLLMITIVGLKSTRNIRRNIESNSWKVPKGSLGWPFIGETLDFIASGYTSTPLSFMDKRTNRYGKVFKTHILGTPIIVSTDADVNKVILLNHGVAFVPSYPKSVRELMGKNSILQMNGSLHKRLHSLIGGFLRSPQFKARATRYIQQSVNLSLATWNQHSRVYIQHETNKIAFEILVKVLMSIEPGEDLNFLKREFEEFIKGLICLPINLPGTRLYKSLKAKEKMVKMVKKIIDERKAGMEKSNDQKRIVNDAVDALLGDNGDPNDTQRLSSDFISCNIIEMMIPGEETVPTAMTLAVKFLSDSPLALKLLVEENLKLKQHKTETSTEYAWTDYMSLTFTQNVINETLRMANIINAVWRKALKDVEINGHVIPKGWCVLASFSSVHMDQENYENPYKFDPFRWEKKDSGVNNNFTPFGGGQRLCPGLELSRLEISIFLHHLVTTYRWIAEDDEIVHFPTVKMKRKMPIVVTPIDKNSCNF